MNLPSPFIGLDIGGTKTLVASAAARGDLIARAQRPTPPDLATGLSLLDELITAVAAGMPPAGIGVAIGGPLDWRTGVVSPLHQPAWREVPLRALLEARWGCPCHIDVDTNIAALGEAHFGGETAPRLLYLTLSTGMGGGFLVDGQIYRGAGGAHPEVAHMAIPYRCANPSAIRCECGLPDCLEALVSGNGIRRIYGQPAETLDDSAWAEIAYNLGQGLRNLAVVYAPDVIVLGGGLAIGRGQPLVDAAAAVMRDHLRLVPPPTVRLSRLGYDTALYGAIAAAMSTPG